MRLSTVAGSVSLVMVLGLPTGRAAEHLPSTGSTVITHAIQAQLKEYESAWNRGDLRAVESQYDSSMFGILQPDLVNYTAYLKAVDTLMAQHPHLQLEIVNVRPLGHDYAAANGTAYTTFSDGHQLKEPFTVIYRRRHGEWKLIYSHS